MVASIATRFFGFSVGESYILKGLIIMTVDEYFPFIKT
ncbi:hypothetical protein APA_5275 [Pseudanabaena sp. lw0831]|nr:hypothetical protein APA_5275 [Pseudanabaena sp. lw0831]